MSVRLALLVATANAEGLYKDGSPVTSYVALSEVPSGAGSDQPFTLLEFYSAWCGHCQKFAPTYEAVALQARRDYPELTVAAVNCVQHDDICNAHGVNMYPTLVLYPGEEKFDGAHNKEAVLAWVHEQHALSTAVAATDAPPKAVATAATTAVAAAAVAATPTTAAATPAVQAAQVHAKLASLVQQQATRLGPNASLLLQHPAADAAMLLQHPAADAAMLKLRPMPRPVPVEDVLAAARYTLHKDVLATLSAAPSHAYARTKLGALRAWLHLLHRALPQGRDGGAAATGASELLNGLHGRTTLPSADEWRALLSRSGVDAWPSAWNACNSTHAELHAYPCALWLLFHSLLAHATEPEALPSLHAIVGYVKEFFGCEDCRGHFTVLAAALEKDLREMASEHQHGRHRAALWLWQAHNHVNERLGAEELTDSAAAQFAEFAKVQWPSRSLCPDCREVSRPHPGVKASVHWRRPLVLKVLYEHFCLEPRFECWDELTRMGESRPPAELSAVFGTYGILAGVTMLLLLACGAARCCGGSADKCAASVGGALHGPRKKRDHIV